MVTKNIQLVVPKDSSLQIIVLCLSLIHIYRQTAGCLCREGLTFPPSPGIRCFSSHREGFSPIRSGRQYPGVPGHTGTALRLSLIHIYTLLVCE